MTQPGPIPPQPDDHAYGQQSSTAPDPGRPYAQPPYPQGTGAGYPPPYGLAPPRPTNNMAVFALVAGIAGLTVVPILGSIAAVILGPMARKEIERTGEEGWSMATAGIITGWIGIALGILLVLFVVAMLALSLSFVATVSEMTAVTG